VLFICAFNLAYHVDPSKPYRLVIITTAMFIAVFTESVLFFILKAKCNTSCINYQTLFNFSLVYNLMCLCLICQILSLYFYKMLRYLCATV
jgi:hypothetical protein